MAVARSSGYRLAETSALERDSARSRCPAAAYPDSVEMDDERSSDRCLHLPAAHWAFGEKSQRCSVAPRAAHSIAKALGRTPRPGIRAEGSGRAVQKRKEGPHPPVRSPQFQQKERERRERIASHASFAE